MSDGPIQPLEAMLRRALSASDFEVPAPTLARALELQRLLPHPAPGGLRAWFDRAVAVLAAPTFDEPAHALQGVRRLSGPRARGWQGKTVSVELEIDSTHDAAQTVAVRGCIMRNDGAAIGPCAIAALLHDGRLALLAASDRDGHFSLELPSVVHALAIATPHETLLLDGVLAPPDTDAPSRHER